MFSIKNVLKNEKVLSPLLCKFAFKYGSRRVQANQ
jgi:hypothetical protein